MKLNKPYQSKQYANFAVYCNGNGLIIEDKGDYLEAVNPPEPTVEEQNEAIRQQRQARFVTEADPLKMDYDEAVARGEDSEEIKTAWLAKKDEIRSDLPYIVEEVVTEEETEIENV